MGAFQPLRLRCDKSRNNTAPASALSRVRWGYLIQETIMGEPVGSKLYSLRTDGQHILLFHCPGCGRTHPYHAENHPGRPRWSWNGDGDKPTFTPSLLVYASETTPRCHLFLTNGMIHYCADSEHELAGRIVPCPDFPADPH